jgi:ABC-type transport system substrate-binding protein
MKVRPGIKWQSPRGFESVDFGELNAHDTVEWLNRGNSTTNQNSTYPDAGDFAAIFLEAKEIDESTVEIGLVTPVYYCVPISQFGCLSAARGPEKVTTVEQMGLNWARANHVGTGPYVQGVCIAGDRCTIHAITGNHWNVDVANMDVKEITGIQVPEAQTRVAMLKNGQIDLAEMDFKLVPGLLQEGFKFLETMPSGFVGDSILWSGNLWEEFHARTNEALKPWEADPYKVDYPWIGNPWGTANSNCTVSSTCGKAPYTDDDNPAGMDDMEQARLVRLALGIAIDRDQINEVLLGNLGTPIYSEYMGPEYPGWDPNRTTGVFDINGNKISASGSKQPVAWQLADGDLVEADRLLTLAGYPRSGTGPRQNWDVDLTLQSYVSEIGEVALEVGDSIGVTWQSLGIPIKQLIEDYGGVISPRMRQRQQFNPVLKNGDVHSNVYPLDWPFPTVDTSSSRPGWGVAFESPAGAKWLFEILGMRDKAQREQAHLTWADYGIYWQQYAGVVQIPKGIVAGPRIDSWVGHQMHYSNVSAESWLIKLAR